MNPSAVLVPSAFLQEIGEYLSFRPYREVASMLSRLSESITRPGDPTPVEPS